jgi:hypothetical protein
MPSIVLRTVGLISFLTMASQTQAQFKPAPTPLPTPMPMPMPMPTPLPMPNPTPMPMPAPTPTPMPTPTPTPIPAPSPMPSLGCPGDPNCSTPEKGDDELSEAAKEILEELAKCEAQGKSIDECLSDYPPPPRLNDLSNEQLKRLAVCVGANALTASKDRWKGCVTDFH